MGAAGSVIAVILTVIIYFLTRKKKVLSYEVLSESSLVSVHDEIKPKLQISYDGNPVENVHLLLLKFINSGNVPITKADFERPITLRLKENSTVLSAVRVKASPDNLTVSIEVGEQLLSFEPVLMNGGDYFTAKILIGQYSGSFNVDARIVGVKSIRVVRRQGQGERVPREWRFAFMVGLSALFIASLLSIFAFLLSGRDGGHEEPSPAPTQASPTPSPTPESTPQEISDANPSRIVVPDSGKATPYPSEINLSGLSGAVSKVTVELLGVSHTCPNDLNILLIGPNGSAVILMAGVGGDGDLDGADLVFDDGAQAMPGSGGDAPRNANPRNGKAPRPRPSPTPGGPVRPGTYRPTSYKKNYEFPNLPPTVRTIYDKLSTFNGTDPNGGWKLYVLDGVGQDSGSIAEGWRLTLTITPGLPTSTPAGPPPSR